MTKKSLGFIVAILNLSARFAFGSCGDVTWTTPSSLTLEDEQLLIVTHPTTIWDPRSAAKSGIDFQITNAKREGNRPTIILRHTESDGGYYTQDCLPAYNIESHSGEIPFSFIAREIAMAGGQFHQCFRQSFSEIVSKLATTPQDARIQFFAEGIYATFSYLDPRAFPSLISFLNIFGNSPSKAPVYATLAQILRSIDKPEIQLDLVENFLNDQRSFPTLHERVWDVFQVKIVLNGAHQRILNPNESKKTLLIEIETEFPFPYP